MSMIGLVSVKNNRYKIKGDFHHLTPNMPIRNADEGWKLMGVTNPRDMTYIHAYGGEAPFFEALSQGKLLATRCDNKDCDFKGTIYQPFRIHCPDCLFRNTIIDMTDIACVRGIIDDGSGWRWRKHRVIAADHARKFGFGHMAGNALASFTGSFMAGMSTDILDSLLMTGQT